MLIGGSSRLQIPIFETVSDFCLLLPDIHVLAFSNVLIIILWRNQEIFVGGSGKHGRS